ncbi:hypothetical protein [Amycolatopsis sp. FDAARGOS 1241]|uniref:beta family protein n=1 Tax=Amycolatopsis sp. FDAARGOS 1241 TaxID=2778070 RepID=UPI0019517EA8|nr:hypothetical protein [Amycolatopsis sp. FDAARGOS 1241]QRP50111.1 hypothetical protein I6J71_21825 [Amycolatopsis sp. FDAARGOS 1241]
MGTSVVQPGDFTALVALRVKEGELMAINNANRAAHFRPVQPLLQFEAGAQAEKQLEDVITAVRTLNGFGRAVMLDASEDAAFGVAGALGETANRLADEADLSGHRGFIPVARCDANDRQLTMLGELCRELGAGGVLRVREPVVMASTVERLLAGLRLGCEDLDLIVDLQYVPKVTSALTDQAGEIIRTFAAFGPFRSTTLLAGSVPGTLSHTKVWEEPRIEEELWHALVAAGAGGLRLGDYGVVHPVPGDGFRAKHVTLRYTCWDHWLYSRERIPERDDETGLASTEPPRARTFRAVCRNVVQSEDYSGPGFSWGDRAISDAAEGRGRGLGSSSKPVAYATSHHLAYLASRAAA